MTALPVEPSTRATATQALSVGAATGAYGISFGALAVTAGLSPLQAVALSALLFSGGSQFALVGVVAAGGSAAAAIASAGLLGVRNGLYGLQVAPLLGVRGVRRLLAAHLTIDESTAVAVAQPSPSLRRLGFWLTGAAVFVCWNAATALGALLGDALGDPRRYGLDAASAAAFLALLWPRLRTREATAVAAGSALLAAVAVPVLPPGVPVLVAAAAVAAVLAVRLRRRGSPRVSTWAVVLVACATCYALKLAGHLAPARLVGRPAVARSAALLTVALLAALVVVQTLATGSRLTPDARVVALGAAAVALALRAPFLLVVVVAAATAAGLRAAGWG